MRRSILVALQIYLMVWVFGVAQAATVQLPQTGQTKCYDAVGTKITCAGTGQDGDKRMGVDWANPRFAIGSGTGANCVTDNLTGLMWVKSPDSITRYWVDALTYANNLNLCGYDDWRLPNINEMKSLLDSGFNEEICGSPSFQHQCFVSLSDLLNNEGFSNVQMGFYLSSTSYMSPTAAAIALQIPLDAGLSWQPKGSNSASYTWPVRGGEMGGSIQLPQTGQKTCYDASGTVISCQGTGQDGDLQKGVAWPVPRFTVNGNGTVTDNLTGLIWLQNANCTDTVGGIVRSSGYLTWADALAWSNNLASGACSLTDGSHARDWRLPNREELESLIDFGHSNPSISDTVGTGHWSQGNSFDNVQYTASARYWSSTSGTFSTSYAYVAIMQSGAMGSSSKNTFGYYVWPVRGGVSIPQGQYNLTTNVNSSQAGTVTPSCTSGCSYNNASVVQLLAVPNSGYVFDGWSGDCAGTNPSVSVSMTAPTSCIANFSPCFDQPLRVGATQFSTFAQAYASASNNGTIDVLATSLFGTLNFDGAAVTLKGGYGCGFSGPSSYSLIRDQIVITTGALTAENLIMMPNDLTGDWDIIGFTTGATPGWTRALVSFDSAGSVTMTSYLTSDGSTIPPPSGSMVASIDSNDTMTLSGPEGNPTFHGSMSSDKTLIIATDTTDTTLLNTYTLYVLRKRIPSVTYSSADVANIQYSFHHLYTGGGSIWVYGTGQTDASGHSTTTSAFSPSGPAPLPSGGITYQIDANGIVTWIENGTYYGIMTPDKKAIFSIETYDATPTYRFTGRLLTGQTFTTSDRAGSYSFHGVDSGTNPKWALGTYSVDPFGGMQHYQSFLNSEGSTTLPTNSSITIDATGAITNPSVPSYHGQMSYHKDLTVGTQTQGTGTFGLSISLKN